MRSGIEMSAIDESALNSITESKDTTNVGESKPEPFVQKKYGLTSSLDYNPPTKEDLNKSHQFRQWFLAQNVLESTEDMRKKLSILEKLNKLTKKWIVGFLTKKRMPESEARSVGGHIRTFGSYRLGIHTSGGDIDAVMIVPMHVLRKDFYESFCPYLASCSDVKSLRIISEAFVPLVKFEFSGVQFDLLFCRIKTYKIADNIELDSPKVLRDMDVKDIRSINGFRIAEDILRLVPSEKNFKMVLHAIRFWAKKNELYSNIVGFFGGITWAILVARICQLYPRAAPAVLIYRFFYIFSDWDWDKLEVLLQKIEYGPAGMTLPQWHRKALDRNKLMSIITPTYPEQNTVHNVSLSTRAIIIEKLRAASIKAKMIMKDELPWSALFEAENFFQCYNHFLILSVHAENEAKLLEFNGFMESRLRHLVLILEKNIFIRVVHPYPKTFDPKPDECIPFTRRWFFGLGINKPEENATIRIDLNNDLRQFETDVMGKQIWDDETNPDKRITFIHCRRKDLKCYLPIEIIGKGKRKNRGEHVMEDIANSPESLQHLLPIGADKRKFSPQTNTVEKVTTEKAGDFDKSSPENVSIPIEISTIHAQQNEEEKSEEHEMNGF